MEDVSYLHPRDPSLCLANRPFKVTRTNLLSLLENETEQCGLVSNTGKVKVFLRVKPLEKNTTLMFAHPHDQLFKLKDSQTLITRTLRDSVVHEFQFTKIFEDTTTQEQVYTASVHNLVADFINGQNCLLFAYGTSSAGKTYTIQGTSEEPGVIPRAINVLFNSICGKESHTSKYKPDMVSRVIELDEKSIDQEILFKQRIMTWPQGKSHGCNFSQSSKSTTSCTSNVSLDKKSECTNSSFESQVPEFISNTFRDMQARLNNSTVVNIESQGDVIFSVWVSFAEIYNENVYDLLEPISSKRHKRQNLVLGEDKGHVYIKGLRYVCVNSGGEAYQVMLYGQHNLQFAATGLNSVSSRSHCIFTIKLLQHVRSDKPKLFRISMFSFCDLAGAERLKNTLNVGERLRESQNINTSLHVLGRCLMTIRDNQMYKGKKLIPFRDSKLTRLFQKALTGKESVTMIVNVNFTPLLREETFNVLMFSAIAKQIVLHPTRHKKRVPRSSRFSQYISQHSTLISNTTREGDITCSSLVSSRESQKLHTQIEVLSNLTDRLKEQITLEREERLRVETEIRRELCQHFSNMMVEAQAEWESRLEVTQLRYEQMGEWRVSKLQDYYQQQSRKRHCSDDSSEDMDSILQVTNTEVLCMTEKLNVTNELLQVSKMENNEVSKKCSKLMFELAQCQVALRNAERIKEAIQSTCEGDKNALTKELESQLAAVTKDLHVKEAKIKELEGILEDAEVDCKHLEGDLKAAEKERDALEVRLTEKETELKHNLSAMSDKQRILDKQLCSLDEKDECIESLEKQLRELKEKFNCGDTEIMTLKIEEQNEKIELLVQDKKSLSSDMSELEKELKDSVDKVLQLEKMEEIHHKEIQELKCAKDSLEDKLHIVEKAEKNTIKEMIKAQNCLEEHRKQQAEKELIFQKEITKLKLQLQSCMDNADFVRSLKEEFENKSSKFEELENENDSLKSSLETKDIEMEHFKENRDQLLKTYEDLLKKEKGESERHKREVQRFQQMFLKSTPTPSKNEYEKRRASENIKASKIAKIRKLNEEIVRKDVELKDCYVKLNRLEAAGHKFDESSYFENVLEPLTVCTGSKDSKSTRQTRKKIADENVQPSLLSSCEKNQHSTKTKSGYKGHKQEEKSKTKNRRKNLFPCNLDDTVELTAVDIEDTPTSMSPTRILRSRRM